MYMGVLAAIKGVQLIITVYFYLTGSRNRGD